MIHYQKAVITMSSQTLENLKEYSNIRKEWGYSTNRLDHINLLEINWSLKLDIFLICNDFFWQQFEISPNFWDMADFFRIFGLAHHCEIIVQLGYNSGHIGNPSSPSFISIVQGLDYKRILSAFLSPKCTYL